MKELPKKQQRRVALTIDQKRKLIAKHRSFPAMTQEALGQWARDEFGLDRALAMTTVSGILKKMHSIETMPETRGHVKKNRPIDPDTAKIEMELFKAIVLAQEASFPINIPFLKHQAQEICKDLNMEKPPITFSNGWYFNFAKRYGLTRLVMHGEGGSAPDIESVRDQVDEIREKLRGVPLSRVYNIDETGLCYMQAPRYTVASNSNQVFGQRKDKTRITVVAIVNGDGSHRIPPIFIGKNKGTVL